MVTRWERDNGPGLKGAGSECDPLILQHMREREEKESFMHLVSMTFFGREKVGGKKTEWGGGET